MKKDEVIRKISEDFGYTEKELNEWKFIEIEAHSEYSKNIFFNGDYVFFATEKIIWF